MTRARLAAAVLLAATLAACSPDDGPTVPAPPSVPATQPPSSPTTTASPGGGNTVPSPGPAPSPTSDLTPRTEELKASLLPTLMTTDGVDHAEVDQSLQACRGGERSTTVYVRTGESPSAEQVLAVLETVSEAGEAAPDGPTSLRIVNGSSRGVHFTCNTPVPDADLAEGISQGLNGEWSFDIVARMPDSGLLADVPVEDRDLAVSIGSQEQSRDEVFAQVPEAWDATLAIAELVGWDHARFGLRGGSEDEYLARGTVSVPVGMALPEGFTHFWEEWTRVRAEISRRVVGHLEMVGKPEGGVVFNARLEVFHDSLGAAEEAEISLLIGQLDAMGLGPASVETELTPIE